MTTGSHERKEHPHTYMVQDTSSGEELARLRIQDQLVTTDMGGLLTEQPEPIHFRRVIDVGCGTGGWLINLAKAYPTIRTLVGVDISTRMVAFARMEAEKEGVADRVEFHAMDALRMIEFPKNYFDLVNQRLNFSYLRTWDWPNLLEEYRRIAHLDGVIRITEGDVFAESNSPALNQLSELGRLAFQNAGHLFTPGRQGVISNLPNLLHQQGLINVQKRVIIIDYHAGTERMAAQFDNLKLAFRTMIPFLRKWTRLPEDYEQIYEQALKEMQQPDFVLTAELMTVWGTSMQKSDKLPTVEHH